MHISEDHCHGHEHEHTHAHEHEHGHTHEHAHEHAHPHGEAQAMSFEETVTLLAYMLDHNRHHADELHDIAHALEDGGKQEAADAVSAALHYFDHCNDALEDALKIAKGE